MHYYNEFDPGAGAWLRELMADGLIPKGIVDERSITEVQPEDLAGFTQCHFFAGISGWPLALRLAGWDDRRPVWTGSCPCQPYSAAGKQLGDKDPRNLWPDFFRLIRECRPDVVFGEQVEGAIRHGWLDGVQADLERESYAVGHCVLGAHSAGAPHIRQRLFWVANAGGERQRGLDALLRRTGTAGRDAAHLVEVAGNGTVSWMADSECDSRGSRRAGVQPGSGDATTRAGASTQSGRCGDPCGLGDTFRDDMGRDAGSPLGTEGEGYRERRVDGHGGEQPGLAGTVGPVRVGDSAGGGYRRAPTTAPEAKRPRTGHDDAGVLQGGPQGHALFNREFADRMEHADGAGLGELCGPQPVPSQLASAECAGGVDWSDSRIIVCRDGKARRIPASAESVLLGMVDGLPGGVDDVRLASAGFPLAGKVPNRVLLLRGFGNAINPYAAAEFVRAYRTATGT